MKHRAEEAVRRPATAKLLAGGVGLVVVYAAGFPLMGLLDKDPDAVRPIYSDARVMAQVQFAQRAVNGTFRTVTVEPGKTITFAKVPFATRPGLTQVRVDAAGTHYTPSDGNIVKVTVDSKGFCVEATDDQDRTTGQECYTNAGPAPS